MTHDVAVENDQRLNAAWALVNGKTDLPKWPREDRFAPSSLELAGKRYRVKAKERYVA